MTTNKTIKLSTTTLLAQQILQQPSITPNDCGCQSILTDRLIPLGFNIESMRFAEVDNLWARLGDDGPLFVFAGHTDVVPVGDEAHWTYPPFSANIIDNVMYARGAADMKGSIAAMLTAVERYLTTHSPAGSIGFLITSDEEGPAVNGTVKVIDKLESRNEKIDWCIVGEPTSITQLGDTIKNGRRGSLSGQLHIIGKQGHVAYPHMADNPIHRALAALDELTHYRWDEGNEFFPATTFQISNIHAGTGAGNVIPAQLEVAFNLRFGTELSVDAIKTKITNILERHDLKYNLQWSLSGLPFITEPGSLTDATKAAITQVCGVTGKLDTGGGTSDGRFIAPTGAQVIELGPCNATIHQVDECVSVPELDELSAIYEQILINLLGDNKK